MKHKIRMQNFNAGTSRKADIWKSNDMEGPDSQKTVVLPTSNQGVPPVVSQHQQPMRSLASSQSQTPRDLLLGYRR